MTTLLAKLTPRHVLRNHGAQLIGYHAPPRGTDNWRDAQAEGMEALHHALNPRPATRNPARRLIALLQVRIALADWNATDGGTPRSLSPSNLATAIGGHSRVPSIDGIVWRRARVESFDYVSEAEGLPLLSDHRHAACVRVRLSRLGRVHAMWFYNLQVGRNEVTVAREIRAILADRPLAVVLSEAVGHHLAVEPGYTLVRDRSNEGRANIAVYVRRRWCGHVVWHDLHKTWARTQHPGQHEPRSFVEIRLRRRATRAPSVVG